MVKYPGIRPWLLKKEIIVLYYGFRDKRTSFVAKLPAILSVIYLLSPIDLIPDFIPFFGYLDDLIIVPLLLNLSIRLLPESVRKQSLLKAARDQNKFRLIFILLIILFIGLLIGVFVLMKHIIDPA